MSQTVSKKTKIKVHGISHALTMKPCDKCGGNGYMKTTPNCYHTCLTCLGKGVVTEKKKRSVKNVFTII